MPDELFSLYWWDRDGGQHLELQHVPADEKLNSALVRLTRGPAAVMGAITRVKVTDTGDCTNFLWEDGKVIFPTKADLEAAKSKSV